MEIVRVKDMYNYYCKDINSSIFALEKDINSFTKTKEYILGNLELCKDYIDKFTKISFEKIKDLDKQIPDHYFGTSIIFASYAEKAKYFVSLIAEINKKLNKSIKDLKAYKCKLLDWKTFKNCLELINKKISNEILKGYSFNFGSGISKIRIKKHFTTEKSKKRIDWKASLKLKEELIAQGKLPFQVTEYDSSKRPITDNGGEKWFIYHSHAVTYSWHWEKYLCKILNKRLYSFRPTVNSNTKGGKYELGNANKLHLLVKEESEQLKFILT